jgi:hypothetical protein
VFTARYALNPYAKQTRFVFKGLISNYSIRSGIFDPTHVSICSTRACTFCDSDLNCSLLSKILSKILIKIPHEQYVPGMYREVKTSHPTSEGHQKRRTHVKSFACLNRQQRIRVIIWSQKRGTVRRLGSVVIMRHPSKGTCHVEILRSRTAICTTPAVKSAGGNARPGGTPW